jgi:DNA-directed RNA polymerase subunit beta
MASTSKPARRYFTTEDTALELPDLIAHQRQSWQDLVETGLSEIFAEINPIEDYTSQKLELRFKDYHFDPPKCAESEARHNNISFEAPLKANVELTN